MIENTLNIDKTIWMQSLKLKITVHIISFCKLIGFIIKYSTNVLVQWIYVVFKIHKVIIPLLTILVIFRRTFVLRLFSGQIFTQSLNFWRQLNQFFFQKHHSKIYMNENSVCFWKYQQAYPYSLQYCNYCYEYLLLISHFMF